MNQRQMEKAIWQYLGAQIDGKTFEEVCEDAGIEPESTTATARFVRAREVVSTQIWQKSR